ncbi:hypothetical protein FHS31_001757 [Sphingomonas vulcanisoli]|uniref:TonB C-terminal domain-containing protein n=1 Tax=Sphingomonas vulcanisoli TaxID=1658060 RepID=A0ABX0TRJ2_9SPHN|nr:energy transducer TonB [Sphingomonas vulcanisoli]NIJ08147.1 hypothetical protein [Sphingomonas vulcanisoli]
MCVSAQAAMAQYAPPAPPPQAEGGTDRLEQMLWDGAVRNNTPDAYQTYLRRYPQGPHSDQARYVLSRPPAASYPQQQAAPAYPQQAAPQQGYPQPQAMPPEPGAPPQAEGGAMPAEPGPPPAIEPPVAPPASPIPAAAPVPVAATPQSKGSPLFLCRPVFASGAAPYEQAGEAEIGAYLQALKVNSVAAYRAYLQAYPHGTFAPAVGELVATREGRAKAIAAANVPGPSQAHPRTPVVIGAADYPQGATGAGSATAIWEVAEDGCVQSCRIEKSSGSPALDAATCRILSARGGYEPARDAAGKPIRSIETGTFSWTPPAK